ncbi:MAG: AarF/ABC1/UbiB kinase family protein [Sphingomonadales bacterium]|jgi:predicted unusual protein kinase regulating ubiquinone biosynthesis (AarF/ABC1/UbiB family)
MAGQLAGAVLAGGAADIARGRRPDVAGALFNPGTALKLAGELARLRGAAMKLGQIISMDGGQLLPPEWAGVFARLRADADPMPPAQLQAQLAAAWGADWRRHFRDFPDRPIAAASIGQVHRAVLADGRQVAVKVQYPGVAASINADVDNAASLIRLSGLVPAGLDLAPLLAAAKAQLAEEADYAREAACLQGYAALVAAWPDVQVPGVVAELSGGHVLVMDWLGGVSVDSAAALPQAERDRLCALLFKLVLHELFDWRLMQTDPNFANYRYCLSTGRLILLDFGAVRAIPEDLSAGYQAALQAGVNGDDAALLVALRGMGLLAAQPHAGEAALLRTVLALAGEAFAPIRAGGSFDFGTTDLAKRLVAQSMAMLDERAAFVAPPPDLLFIQRKLGGMALLASSLKARLDVRDMLGGWVA